MLRPEQVLDHYFLDVRHMLIEIGATLDRYDAAGARDTASTEADPRLARIREAIRVLDEAGPTTDRAERLLLLFSEPKE